MFTVLQYGANKGKIILSNCFDFVLRVIFISYEGGLFEPAVNESHGPKTFPYADNRFLIQDNAKLRHSMPAYMQLGMRNYVFTDN